MAFQAVQSVSIPVQSGYTGPIMSGDELEIEELERKERRLLFDMMDEAE